MTHPSRREFLVAGGAVVAAGAMLGSWKPQAASAQAGTVAAPSIPAHRSLSVSGVHLYTDRPTYRAGDVMNVQVSATIPASIEIVRLGDDPDSLAGDVILHSRQIDRPIMQPVHPGSYVHIERGLSANPCPALTIECWVRLWNPTEPQGIITQLNNSNGWGLLALRDGTLAFFTGECADPVATPHCSDAKLTLAGNPSFSPYVTPPASWHHVVAIVGGEKKLLWLDGRRVGQWEWKQGVASAQAPLRIGAWGRDGAATGFLDADIAMPAVYGRALDETEIRARHAERGLTPPPVEPDLLGCWPLVEERGDVLADVSGAERTGKIINHGTWMIGGPSFLPAIPRYRRDYDPDQDATRGHGLRLASDDLYDCRWAPTLTFKLPPDSRSGLYAVRARFTDDGMEKMTHASFVVRRAAKVPAAPIALLFATNTWKAYSGAPFAPAWPGLMANVSNKGYQPKPDDPLAGYCFYRFHRAGQPTYQLGWRIPWPAASPYALVTPPEVGYSHLARADRFAQSWLVANGYSYDALSDMDLHQDPHALEGAKVLFIVGHNEYWTREAMQRVRKFLDRGGHVVCLSGNTMYWRVTQSDDGAVLECRKADAWGAQLADYMRGECWHEHDRRRGGVPRDCGDPEWRTLGVEFAGATAMSANVTGAFQVTDAEHPFFHVPREVGLNHGDRFAFDRAQLSRHPVGHESDVRVSTLMNYTRRMPVLVGMSAELEDAPGVRLLAVGRLDPDGRAGSLRDYAHRVLPPSARRADDSLCDVIHWQRPDGGQVFAAPSISAAWALAACPHWSDLLRNVLHHFGVPGAS